VKQRTDRADVLGLLAGGKTDEAAVRDVLTLHRPDLLPALERILQATA
jgi:hypothetical protein